MSRSKIPEAYAEDAARVCLFAGLTREEVARTLCTEGAYVAHFEKGAVIYRPDGFDRCAGFLVYGEAVVSKGDGESRIFMSVLKPGALFGAATLFMPEESRYVSTITATRSAWAVMLPEDTLLAMMRADFRIAKNYMAYLTARIRFLSGRIENFAEPTAEERVLRFLQKNAVNGAFRPSVSISAIAEALCIGRTTLYRALDTLEQKGLIKKDGRLFRLPEGDTK